MQVYFIFKFSTTRVHRRFPHTKSLQWRHNDHDGVSNHQPRGCLLKRLYMRWSKKTSKLRVTGLCEGNSPGPVNSPHKGPVTRKMFPFDDVIMILALIISLCLTTYRCHPLRRACRHRGHCNNSYWGYHSPASSRDPQVGVVYVSTPRLQSRGRSRPAIRRLLLWCTSSWNRMMFHLQIHSEPINQSDINIVEQTLYWISSLQWKSRSRPGEYSHVKWRGLIKDFTGYTVKLGYFNIMMMSQQIQLR